MNKFYIILLFSLFSNLAIGQKFNIQLSDKHLKKVERSKSAREKLKKYRKLYTKDSLKAVKKDKKYWRHKSDSLDKVLAKQGGLEELSEYGLSDSTALDTLNGEFLASYVQELASNSGMPEYDDEIEEAKGYGEALRDKEKAKALISEKGKEYQGELIQQEELTALGEQRAQMDEMVASQKQYGDELNGYYEQMEDLDDPEAARQKAKELSKEQAEEFMAKNANAIKLVQEKIGLLQNKYSKVISSDDLSTAEKRSSLEGKPFKQRLFIGGNFNVTSTDPIAVDLILQIGYKFNRRFVVGVGMLYRKTFSNDSIKTVGVPENGIGYNAFTSYDIVKSFFAYGEYSALITEEAGTGSDGKVKKQVDGLMLGIGKKMSIHPNVNMTIMLLYDFFHKPMNSLTPKPFSIKIGFQLSELAMLKK